MQLPLFAPNSDWKAPDLNDLPDFKKLLSGVKIGVDTETCDPGLMDRGPGFIRGTAEVVGISLSVDDKAWYLPIRHRMGTNMDQDKVTEFLKYSLGTEHDKVFANAMYDVEGLDHMGVQVKGRWNDVMVSTPLLNEELYGGYSLDNIARNYLKKTKDETKLREAANAFGVDPKSELYKLDPIFVGAYAEADAQLPVQILKKQMKKILDEDMGALYKMECDLLRPVYEMRKKGIRVDLEGAEKLGKKWTLEAETLEMEIRKELNANIRVGSPKSLEYVARITRTPVIYTAAGNPSFKGDWFDKQEHPIWKKIARIRKINKSRKDFIASGIQSYEINGRIHSSFYTTKRDDGGTRTGRFSSSNPNMQQIPSRDEEMGPAMRNLFLPDEGDTWYCADYSSQEIRWMVHMGCEYGIDTAWDAARMYHDNPTFDFHQWVADLAGITRRNAKDVAFGVAYGMSLNTLAEFLGMSKGDCNNIYIKYKLAVPFVQESYEKAMSDAQDNGYSVTHLGRRRHFRKSGDDDFTYKAYNSRIQGSSADQIKQSIIDLYYEHGIVPSLQVHDELNFSFPTEELQHAAYAKHSMENCFDLHLPFPVDMHSGATWYQAKG
jgi:DNA polymerase I-like protein with 3'-5' exonuclease and polymerase domains